MSQMGRENGVCQFLLVINNNPGSIFHRFRDMAGFY